VDRRTFARIALTASLAACCSRVRAPVDEPSATAGSIALRIDTEAA
jgi:hypothetical protein